MNSAQNKLMEIPAWCNNTVGNYDACGLETYEFDAMSIYEWMRSTRYPATFFIFLYVVVVVDFGPRFMKDRAAWSVARWQFGWNSLLAAYSIVSTYLLMGEFTQSIQKDGFYGSLCTARDYYTGPSGTAVWMFHMSKCVELGDTMWLIVRKRHVPFLHWYHHSLILLNAWFSYLEAGSLVRIGTMMNLCVHSVMYSYFALQYLVQKRIPRVCSLLVTTMQITQFVIGTYILFNTSYRVFVAGEKCDSDVDAIWRHIIMYVSYLLLFVHFFYKSYIHPTPKKGEGKKIE